MCKTLKLGLLAFAVLGITFLGCDKLNAPITPDDPGKTTSSDFTTDLIVAQNIVAGQVQVMWTYDNIYVKYTTNDDWHLTEYHVAVVTDCETGWEPYMHNGNPAPGLFPYSGTVGANPHEIIVTIPMTDEWRAALELCFATHCVVVSSAGGGDPETGWGEGEPFPGHNWAMYFCTPPFQGRKIINLPPDPVQVQFIEVVGQTPTKFLVTGVPPGYQVENNHWYYAFCLDRMVYITGQQYTATLWNPFGPLPQYIGYNRVPNPPGPGPSDKTPWDVISWLADYYMDNVIGAGAPHPTPGDVAMYQHVFWHFRALYDYSIMTDEEKALHDLAMTYGPGYRPNVGDWYAVPMDIYCTVQLNFIMVDP